MNNNMDEHMIPLSAEDSFSFACNNRIACFNECCRDLNQFLTPYDVLRIKSALNLSSTEFIQNYCQQHVGPESGMPVLTLKPGDTLDLVCPFVTPSGCKIYEDRPSSCRMYPLARAIARSRETGTITEYFMRLKEPHCLGHHQDNTQTVEKWMRSQKLEKYNEMNDLLMEIISLKNQLSPGPMDFKTSRFFFMACYDLDAFRIQVFEKNILGDMEADATLLESAKSNDAALLKIGMSAMKQFIMKEIQGI